jgi:hypothetical protein
MNQAVVMIGAFILITSVFSLSYSNQQQGLINEAEDALAGEQQNWELLESISMAGVVLGIILVAAGLVPNNWYQQEL